MIMRKRNREMRAGLAMVGSMLLRKRAKVEEGYQGLHGGSVLISRFI